MNSYKSQKPLIMPIIICDSNNLINKFKEKFKSVDFTPTNDSVSYLRNNENFGWKSKTVAFSH